MFCFHSLDGSTTTRKRRYLARPPWHVPGQWPQPVARGQGWLYVSTWTSMRLAPVRCRMLLHSLLPTDDACSSSSLSMTVIKFSIFSDPTRKLSALAHVMKVSRGSGVCAALCIWRTLCTHVTICTSLVIFCCLTVFWLFLTIRTLYQSSITLKTIGVPIVTGLQRLYQQCTKMYQSSKQSTTVKRP